MNAELKTTVSIIGGSGYGGGELLRLLLGHPQVEVKQVTSRSHVGEYVYQVHPNLRKRTQLKFSDPSQLEPVDVLFLAQPHGQAQHHIEAYAALAGKIIDLSADFRLKDPANYQKWYGEAHTAPQWLGKFVYGLPELHRAEMAGASYISGVGCNATASNLALLPLVKAGLIELDQPIFIEIKVGSSESGAEGNSGSLHAERANVVRTFSAFGHRHTAEVIQELGVTNVSLTMTAVDLVRGVLAAGLPIAAVGGVRISEPAADLAVLLAIQGSLRGKALPRGFIAFGEVGLAGEVRPAPRGQERLKEAAKLGFSIAVITSGRTGSDWTALENMTANPRN